MKPREFDELVRQKFDQGDFEYNPRNWEMLEEKMDGRAKKRSLLVWWAMPLAGMAASVALAIGITSFWKNAEQTDAVAGVSVKNAKVIAYTEPKEQPKELAVLQVAQPEQYRASSKNQSKPAGKSKGDLFVIKYENAVPKVKPAPRQTIAFNFNSTKSDNTITPVQHTESKKKVIEQQGYATFKDEGMAVVKAAPKFSVIVSGGLSQGNQNRGYAAGATIRRMVNSKVYVEGDVNFAQSNNTQSTKYLVTETSSSVSGITAVANTARQTTAGKYTSPTATIDETAPATREVIRTKDVSYGVYYAQVTPSVGYQVMKRMSLAAGPDFQKMLVDNRPAPSTVDRGTLQEAPSFDVGLVGKTEYALTRTIRAGVYYRKGINNVITPTGKYIDRDYLQFQVKCTVFNK